MPAIQAVTAPSIAPSCFRGFMLKRAGSSFLALRPLPQCGGPSRFCVRLAFWLAGARPPRSLRLPIVVSCASGHVCSDCLTEGLQLQQAPIRSGRCPFHSEGTIVLLARWLKRPDTPRHVVIHVGFVRGRIARPDKATWLNSDQACPALMQPQFTVEHPILQSVLPATNGECTFCGGFVTPRQLSIPPWDMDWRDRLGGRGVPGDVSSRKGRSTRDG